jgi:hypothetical protein
MNKPRKSSAVPGQALGFSLQYTKMTELLARSAPGGEVEFEGLDDLSLRSSDGQLILFQAKSALETNPLSNRAIAFWKALANWVEIIVGGELDTARLKLVFYVSNPVTPGGWAQLFDLAVNESAVESALNVVRNALWGPAPEYPLRKSVAIELAPHLTRFFEAPIQIQRDVVRCFGSEVVQESIHSDLITIVRFVDPRRHADVLHHACAWTKQRVDELIAKREPAKVRSDDFAKEMTAYIRRFNERSILQSFAPAGPNANETEQLKLRTFVRQLELIAVDYSDQLQAISDYYRASIDRTKLGDSGEVHPSSFDALDDALHRTWRNIVRQKEIAMKDRSDEERGELVYRECVQQRLTIENQQPPEHFIPGCYHLLADDAKLGWHPHYEKLLASLTENQV